jgi:hypothetical protein
MMARIRSIKPEFWVSEQIVECSPMARLMFIGMWNFCDDYGIHPASEKRLKMEIFPSDDITSDQIRGFVNELIAAGLILEYEVDNRRYWQVTGWGKHQRPESKTGLYPQPSGELGSKVRRKCDERSTKEPSLFDDDSSNDRQPFDERSTKTVSEGEGEGEGEGSKPLAEHDLKIVFDGQGFKNLNGHIAVWEAAYPAINVDGEIAKAAAWIVANPKNVKKQWGRFLNSWLSRSQDRAPRVQSDPNAGVL